MDTPRLSPEVEDRRKEIVDDLSIRTIREDAALQRISEAITSICDVPVGHVSLMESEQQCVVGQVGLEVEDFDREETFCAYTMAKNGVMIVEDAADDPRFRDNPFVTQSPGVSFYAGIPLLVDNTPVGTLVAIDSKPRRLDPKARSELFGLVNTVESHLQVIYRYGSRSAEHGISSKLTAIRALSIQERFLAEGTGRICSSLRELEAEATMAFKLLIGGEAIHDAELGFADTDVTVVDEAS